MRFQLHSSRRQFPLKAQLMNMAGGVISKRIGFLAGWLFVSSKILESAAVALAFGAYAALFIPVEGRIIAALAVMGMACLNVAGIRATTDASKLMVGIKLGALAP